jgi:hypothetical protein
MTLARSFLVNNKLKFCLSFLGSVSLRQFLLLVLLILTLLVILHSSVQTTFCVLLKRYIEHLLETLDVTKSSDPDGISAKMLKSVAQSIAHQSKPAGVLCFGKCPTLCNPENR